MGKFAKVVMAIMFNAVMGVTFGIALGFAPIFGAMGAVGLSLVAGAFMPAGVVGAGGLMEFILKEFEI